MKKLLTLTAAVISFNAAAVVIEDDAIIEYVSHQQVEAAVKLVRAKGYRCDSVSSLMPTLRGGFTLKCNNWRYVYSIADRGGRYVVTVG